MGTMNFERDGSPVLGYFISPHGFGHAARAAAVMSALQERRPGIRFEIFTTVPEWFFEESLSEPFGYHALLTDVGLVQKGPFCADLPGTVARLNEFLPFNGDEVKHLAEKLNRLNCAMMFCDISPMGIAVAQEAGVPSVLVENFTWDWVYREYMSEIPGFEAHMDYLASRFTSADFHIQTSPVCSKGPVDLTTGPVSRVPRHNRSQVRNLLGIPDGAPMVLITMGGIPKQHRFMAQLARQEGIFFVAPGGGTSHGVAGNVTLLPHHSEYFHPDLVGAADAVVGKVGYSTLSEVYHSELPYGYIKRTRFHESEMLSRYIDHHMAGFAIDERDFERGDWILRVPELLDLPLVPKREPNGAEQVADFFLKRLERFCE